MVVCWWKSSICLVVLLCCPAISSTQNCASFYPVGDIFLVKGEPLSLNCTTRACDPDLSIHNLSITKVQAISGARRNLTANSTHFIAVDVPETTMADNGTYFCYLNGKMQDLKLVRVGELPEPPKSIHCVSLNWMKMTCYVELSQNNTHLPTSWTMEYKNGWGAGWSVPGQCSKTVNACELSVKDGFSRFGVYDIRVHVKNKLGEASLDLLGVEPENIVKPDPVANFAVTKTENSSVLKLTWKFPALLPNYMNMTYRISVKTEEGWDDKTVTVDNIFTSSDYLYTYMYMLRDLIPYTVYNVSLSAKPVRAIGEWYWSDPVTKTIRTDIDVPGHSTLLTEGSYYAQDCGGGNICPVIYWKNPERRYAHGEITGYQLNISQIELAALKSLSSTKEPASHTAITREVQRITGYSEDDLKEITTTNLIGKRVFDALEITLLKNESYIIKMRASTEKGFSRSVSDLLIPSWDKAKKLRPLRVIVEIYNLGDGYSALLSWETALNISCERGLQEIVYWCSLDKSQGNQTTFAYCKDDFQWQELARAEGCSNSTETVRIPDGKHADDMMFGVSVGIDGVNPGIQWEACRFDAKYDAPAVPLYRVDPVAGKYTELKITVLFENCYSREGGRPTAYHVVYKRFNGPKDDAICPEGAEMVSYPVDFDNPVMYLRNLEVRTQYVVCMRADNEYQAGSFGKPNVVTTSEPQVIPAPQSADTIWIWITLGGVAAVVILVGLGILCCKHLKRRTKILQIDVPDITLDSESRSQEKYSTGIGIKEDDKDSGLECSSSTASQVNGNKRVSMISGYSGDNVGSSVPILAEQVKTTRSPSAERKRKISPSLSGYERPIRITSNEFYYDECETGSLLENEGFENGVENDLDIERIITHQKSGPECCIKEKKTKEIPDKTLKNTLNKDGETSAVNITDETVHYSARGSEVLKNEVENTVAVNPSKDFLMKSEYVEEDDMNKLSKKNAISDDTSHSQLTERKHDKMISAEEPDNNSITKPFRAWALGNFDQEGNSFAKLHQPQPNNFEERQRKFKNLQDEKILLNGFKDYQSYQKGDESENCERKEVITHESYEAELEGDSDSLSDIDMDENEDMFFPSVGCGDAELTDFLEEIVKSKHESQVTKLGTNNAVTNGYIDADQISITSLASNASSLQEQSAVPSQDPKHLTRTRSLLHVHKETGIDISQTEINNTDIGNENKCKKVDHQNQADLLKESTFKAVLGEVESNSISDTDEKAKSVENKENDIIKNTSAGNSSGSVFSSYVTAKNLQINGLSKVLDECRDDQTPEKKIKLKDAHKEDGTSNEDSSVYVVGHIEKGSTEAVQVFLQVDSDSEKTHL